MNYPYLLSCPISGNTYYFRSKIPKDLTEHFGGVKEFRISLKCAIKSRSVRVSKILAETVSGIYEEIRQGMKSLDVEQIKEILRIEIRKQILHAHHIFEGTNRWDDDGRRKSLDSIQKKETNLKDTLKSNLKSYQDEVDSKLEGILESLDIQVEKGSVAFKKLRNNFIDLYLLRHEWMKELVFETGKTDEEFRRDAELKVGMELFPDVSWLPQDTPKTYVSPPTAKKSVGKPLVQNLQKTVGETISENAKRYFDKKRIEGRRTKSILYDEGVVAEFIEIVGDIDFSALTKKEVNHYIDVQTKLPPNRKKTVKYKNLSIAELLEMNLTQDEVQIPQNINKRLTKLNVFGNWAIRQGLLTVNPFTGMKFSVSKQAKKREPFKIQELKKILKPDTYLEWTVNFEHRFRNGRATNQIPYYWVFLWGIFSGLRTNEMCQARLTDFKKEKNIWFMQVKESADTKVKTLSAIRKVPVHPKLIELGFLDYITTLKRKKKDRVFWELREERDGFAAKVSRHFNERMLPALGIWRKHTKVLYCTRHTFVNCLYTKGVDENIIKALVGHEKEFTMKHYGGDPYSPEQLLKAISKVSYSGINWKGLKLF